MIDRAKINDIVYEAVSITFKIPREQILPLTTAGDVEGWDSISNSNLYMELEDQVGRELPINLMLEAANIGDLCEILERFLNH